MRDANKLYKEASPQFIDILHEIRELEEAIRKNADFLDLDFRDPGDDEEEREITYH